MKVQKSSAEVVIIGAGVAGSMAAYKMAQAGIDVLVLESGPELDRDQIVENFRNSPLKGDFMDPYPEKPWAPQPKFQPLDNGYLIQKGPSPYQAMYLRGVGGTTWHWAGEIFRLLPNDFRLKSLYGVGRDWPISYDDLEPYYHAAEVEMGVSGDTDLDSPRSQPYPMSAIPLPYGQRRIQERMGEGRYAVSTLAQARNSREYDGRPACCGNNNCMPICPIGAMYNGGLTARKARDSGAQIISNAVVYRLEADARGRIVAVHYLDPMKVSHRVTGKTFILAANGIESPKLLLISADDRHPQGIANSSGQVGRNLMDHPASSVEFFADEPVWFGRGPQRPAAFNNFRDGDYRRDYASTRIDLAATNPVRYLTEKLVAQGYYGDALNDKLAYQSQHYVLLKSLFEMLPDPDNRVVVSKTAKDAWGIPRLEVHYAFPEYVNRAYDHCVQDFQHIVQTLGGKEAVYSPRGVYANNQHITGTMLMGSDPTDSVVDGQCRSHDHENLFIVGTGIMPSSACVNSTLTGAALALMGTDHAMNSL
ncbi:GMC family oxidoreductase [Frateuria aurantia]